MNQNQVEVLQWWHGGRDYQQGVMLLSKYGKNKVLVHTLLKPGKERFGGRAKLEYELPKAVGLHRDKMPVLPEELKKLSNNEQSITNLQNQKTNIETGTSESEMQIYELKILGKQLDQYPKIIRQIKYEYAEKYKQRSILHQQMRGVAPENTVENCKIRAGLLLAIKNLSGEMDFLHEFINEYVKTGKLPKEETVWPSAKEEKPAELPADIEELRKLKKNLQTSNSKDRNSILYQQKTKLEKERPMPAGPKRKRIEMRIAEREKEILKIDEKIFEIEQKC